MYFGNEYIVRWNVMASRSNFSVINYAFKCYGLKCVKKLAAHKIPVLSDRKGKANGKII